MQQVLKRLFPFGRGLCHSYWAPNFWVFYIVLDKGLVLVLRSLHFNIHASEASFTGGLVGDAPTFTIIPQISLAIGLGVVLLAMLPCIVQVWRFPCPKYIIRWVGYAYTCGFLFGWHVHEKASLHFVIPHSLILAFSAQSIKRKCQDFQQQLPPLLLCSELASFNITDVSITTVVAGGDGVVVLPHRNLH